MGQDYILRLIDKAGEFLKVLLTGISNTNEVEKEIENISSKINNEFGIDIFKFINLSDEEMIEQVSINSKLNSLNVQIFAEILFEIGNKILFNKLKLKLFNASLVLFKYENKKNPIYSLEKHFKMDTINQLIENLKE